MIFTEETSQIEALKETECGGKGKKYEIVESLCGESEETDYEEKEEMTYEDTPERYCDKITDCIFKYPIFSHGYIIEFQVLFRLFMEGKMHPITNTALDNNFPIYYECKSEIEEYLQKNKEKEDERYVNIYNRQEMLNCITKCNVETIRTLYRFDDYKEFFHRLIRDLKETLGDIRCYDKSPFVHLICKYFDSEIIQYIIDEYPLCMNIVDSKTGETPIYEIIRNGNDILTRNIVLNRQVNLTIVSAKRIEIIDMLAAFASKDNIILGIVKRKLRTYKGCMLYASTFGKDNDVSKYLSRQIDKNPKLNDDDKEILTFMINNLRHEYVY
jgi:hypothetical protein